MNDNHTMPRRVSRRFLAFSTALAVTAALGGIAPVTAGANEVDGSAWISAGHGDVLSVDVAGKNVINAAVSDSNDTTQGPDKDSLNLSVLEAVKLDLGSGLQLPLIKNGDSDGLLELGNSSGLGLLSSFAKTQSQTNSTASAGTLAEDGSIAVDGATEGSEDAATINATPLLTQVLGADIAKTILDEAEIKVGALGAIATKNGAEIASKYDVADLTLDVHSPLVDQVVDGLDTTIEAAAKPIAALAVENGTIDTTVKGLTTTLDALPLLKVDEGSLSVGDLASVTDAVREELLKSPITNADKTVTIDLSSGTVQVDLEKIVLESKDVTSLDSLPPNTELLDSEVVTAIVNGVTEALTGTDPDSLTSKITSILTQKIYDLELTVSLNAAVDATDVVPGTGAVSDLTKALTSIVGEVGDTTGSIVNGAGQAAQGAAQTGATVVDGVVSGAGTGVSTVTDGIKDATEGTGPVGETLGGAVGAAGGAVEGATEAVGGLASGVLNTAGDAAAAAGNAAGGSLQRTTVGDVALRADTQPLNLIELPITIKGTLGGFLGKEGAADPEVKVDETKVAGLAIGETVLQPLVDTVQESVATIGTGLNATVDQAVAKLNPTVTTTVDGVLTPLIGDTGALKKLLENLASIEVNDQPTKETPADEGDLGEGSFTVRALNVQLLPNVADSLINIELGSATVKAADKAVTSAEAYDPIYNNGVGKPGETVKIAAPTFDNTLTKDVVEKNAAPEGTTFAAGEGAPKDVTVESTGAVSIPVDENAKPGEKITVPVTVTYADKSTDSETLTVMVQDPDAKSADIFDPIYGTLNAQIGKTTTGEAPVDKNGLAFPANTKFALDDSSLPWVSIDEKTGAITVAPPADTAEKDYTFDVTVTYPDASTDEASAPVSVTIDGQGSAGNSLKCSDAVSEIGKLVALLIPVGLLTQINIPGVDQLQAQLNEQFKAANANLQQQLGIFNPELAAWVESVNAQLSSVDVLRTVGGAALVIAGLKAAQLFIENCLLSGGSSEDQPAEDQSSSNGSSFGSSFGSSEQEATKDDAEQ